MNPFNQARYRGEHELGRAYMDIRRALDNLADIKFVADNIRNFRSGNIELSSEGSVLKWKYVKSDEWFDLVDLSVINEPLEEDINTINDTLQNLTNQLDNFNNQLDNFNGIVSNLSSQLSALTQRVEETEEFEDRIALLESAIASLTSRVEALEGTGGSE